MTKTLKNFFFREDYREFNRCQFQDIRVYVIFGIAFYLCALFLRSWENILNPGLYMEDATHYFNQYYGGKRYLSFILQHPNGYYNILNNLVAWTASKLDVRLQPLAYHIFCLSTGILTATCILFSGLIRNRSIIIVTPLVLGLSGMNHIYYYTSLTFQMYNVVILLLCLLFFPAPRSAALVALMYLTAALLAWSGPYSVVALPVSLLFLLFFKNNKKTFFFAWVIICVILYSLSVRESTIMLSNVFDENIRRLITATLFERVFFLDLLGKMSAVKITLFFLPLFSAIYALRKNTFYLKTSIILFAIILGALAPFFLSIKFQLYLRAFPCHIYISQFFWLLFVLVTMNELLEKFQPGPFLKYGTISLFLLLITVDTLQHPVKGKRKIMHSIPAFVQTIHFVEQLGLEEKNQYVVVKTENIIPGTLPPMVRVGSLRPDAKRIRRKDIQIPSGKEFIVE